MKRSTVFQIGWTVFLVVAVVLINFVRGQFGEQKQRGPANFNGPFIAAAKTDLAESEIEKRIGIPAIRFRAVTIDTDLLFRQRGEELKIQFQLFPDVAPMVTLKVLSGLDVNEGMHSGFAADEPNSRVNLTTANGMVSGFIEYRGKKYRIVADPGAGVHYIAEEK